MRKGHLWALGGLLTVLAAMLCVTSPARSEKPKQPETTKEHLARVSTVKPEDVEKVWNALGPVIREELGDGKTISVPGLGVFRVVRVAEHKDLQGGRPVLVPAVNTVEFLPVESMVDAANAPGAKPAETVPAFQYNPIPGQTPGQYTPSSRAPSVRTRD